MKCEKCGQEIKKNTIIVKTPYGKIEIEKEIHHKNKTYAECEKDCPKGWQIATYEILQYLRNSKYIDELNLRETWEFIVNIDKISLKNKYVAGFDAYSGRVGFGCYRYPDYRHASLGVRYMRFIQKLKGVGGK